jgi:hypothetical protein
MHQASYPQQIYLYLYLLLLLQLYFSFLFLSLSTFDAALTKSCEANKGIGITKGKQMRVNKLS